MIEAQNIIIPNYSADLQAIKEMLREVQLELEAIRNGDYEKDAFSVLEAANRLDVSKGTVRNLYQNGQLEYYQADGVGSKVFIKAESVRNFIANRKAEESKA